MGDLEGMGLHVADMLAPAERLRDRYWLASALVTNRALAQLNGDWGAARDFSDRGMAVAPDDPRHLLGRVILEYEVGNFAQGESYLK